jgi:hypothetical protein
MRIPLNSIYTPPKDDRKVIMFIDDLFHSKSNPALEAVKELLNTEYRCITIFSRRGPEAMVKKIRWLSLATSAPDLIVAYGTGATIAAQIKDVEKVLIKPYYNTSNVLKNMLGEKNVKARIELPTLGNPEYLTIARPMMLEYKHLEMKAMENGYNNGAHLLFFAKDVETDTYKEHIRQLGDALIAPGEGIFDPDSINGIAKFIRGVIEA